MTVNKSILGLIFLLYAFSGKAEIFPTFSIVELSFKADTVVEAIFLKKENDDYIFLINKLNEDENYDTLVISNINRLFNQSVNNYSSRQCITFETSDKLLIYLLRNSSNELVPVWSGYRLLKDSFVYLPYQPVNPGKFSFARSRDSISWDELLTKVQLVHARIQNLKKIKNIKDPNLRNQKLFTWIEHNKSRFGQNCGLNDECGWGSIEWDVFKWITEGNIAHDTWKASKLYRQVHFPDESEWLGLTGLLSDYNGNSFNSYDDIDFLISVAISDSRSMIEKKQSLAFLRLASRKVYENNYPIPETLVLNKQKRKQKSIRDHLLPLLENPDLKSMAFQVIRSMSNPRDGNLEHRIDLEVLPLIKKHYRNDRPSKYKSELAEFIVHNSTEEEWKKLSKCDANIFVDLYHIYIDNSQNELKFGINYNYGKEPIKETPIIEIQKLTSDKLVMQTKYHEFKLPYRNWNGVRYLKIDIGGLDKGKYKVYVKGKAGEESQYNWESAYGEFEIQ